MADTQTIIIHVPTDVYAQITRITRDRSDVFPGQWISEFAIPLAISEEAARDAMERDCECSTPFLSAANLASLEEHAPEPNEADADEIRRQMQPDPAVRREFAPDPSVRREMEPDRETLEETAPPATEDRVAIMWDALAFVPASGYSYSYLDLLNDRLNQIARLVKTLEATQEVHHA